MPAFYMKSLNYEAEFDALERTMEDLREAVVKRIDASGMPSNPQEVKLLACMIAEFAVKLANEVEVEWH